MPDLLDGLDPGQRAAAEAVNGPVCIVAGAGTGKTRTVTHRLAHGVISGAVNPRRALAITHSRKAAAELGERLSRLGVGGVDARTFHAAGLWVAGRFWARTARPGPSPAVMADREGWRLWRDSLRAVTGAEPDTTLVRVVMEEVGWARSRLIAAAGYLGAAQVAGRDPGVDLATIVQCWEGFTHAKRRLGKVDFADLLEIASDLLATDKHVADRVRARWSHVTVDEYQDTDPAQQHLLEGIVGDGRDVCVVGDPRQAIYSWKGADVRFLTEFTMRYPDAQAFNLTRNYRSTPQILAWANRLAPGIGTPPLAATRPAGLAPEVTQLVDETGETAWVVDAARRAMAAGTPASEIGVLYRFNATQARFEAAFASAGIPIVVADDATFFDREDIRAVLVPFGHAARAQPQRGGLDLLVSVLAEMGFDRDSPPAGEGAAGARWQSQCALLDLVEALPEVAAAEAALLLAKINEMAVRTHGPRTAGVTLATLHRAKGLEWDVVFVVGVADGAFPSVYATTPEQRAEEQRLLYVGVTRARRQLYLTWSAGNVRGWANRPSPYLELLTGRPARLASGTKPAAAAECPHCMEPLKGIAARRLGVCADCVMAAPGELGKRARALAVVISDAARATGRPGDQLVGPAGLLRLLHQRPATPGDVATTAGVGLEGLWAQAAAEVLQL